MLTWIFITLTLVGVGLPVRVTHGPYGDEDACDEARSAWLRELTGPVLVVELGQCELLAP